MRLVHLEKMVRDVASHAPEREEAPERDSFRSIVDHAPAMIWVTAPDAQCTYLNHSWYDYTGQTEEEALGFGWLEATHPEDRADAERTFRAANESQAPFELVYRLRTRSGCYRWVIDAGRPRFAAGGEFLGYVGSVVDIHDRHETEERLRSLTNTVPAFVWFASPDGAVHYLNDRWYEYTGQTGDEALGDGWMAALHPDDAARVVAIWMDCIRTGHSYETESRYRRKDGVYRWYIARAEPMRGGDGAILAWMGTCIDIEDRKLGEQRQALLVNELNHRVKNTLATVQAIASQTLQVTPEPELFQEAFEERIVNLARAHDLLTASGWAGATLGQVVERTLAPWPPAEFETGGPEVWLEPQQALSISLALHELATNAGKYGALRGGMGRVAVRWIREVEAGGETVRLQWKERGGPPVAPPAHRGFGSRLLERGLGRELQGHVALTFPADGVECLVSFPLRHAQNIAPTG